MDEFKYVVVYETIADSGIIANAFSSRDDADTFFESVKWQKRVFLLKILKKMDESVKKSVPFVKSHSKRNKKVQPATKKNTGVVKKTSARSKKVKI
jgi:hypothetical protein